MTSEIKSELLRTAFPQDFRWGTATASYQIEGAVHQDGRGPSIWDVFSHTPGKIDNGDNGDIACDHYYRYKEDVAIMSKLGINSYRFSISWPRILPEGTGKINQAGLDFYSRLVDELLANGIEPFATLYHWDLPQVFEDKGGWSNRETAYHFAEYADIVSRHLGDRVKGWITLNEPGVSATLGYLTGQHAPGHTNMNEAVRATHHLLLAHGLAIPRLRQNATRADAEFGVTLNFNAVAGGNETDQEVIVTKDAWDNRLFLDPLFKGSYPGELSSIIDQHLPVEPGDMATISVPVDFLGINYYFRTIALEWIDRENMKIKEGYNENAPHTIMGWEVYPEGLYKLLMRFHEDYHISKMYITENGSAYQDELEEKNGETFVHDPERLSFLQQHLQAVLRAVQEGVPVEGYFVWSLLDNFEWAYGYDKRFGIVHVDYATQQRIIKDSGWWYRNFLAH